MGKPKHYTAKLVKDGHGIAQVCAATGGNPLCVCASLAGAFKVAGALNFQATVLQAAERYTPTRYEKKK